MFLKKRNGNGGAKLNKTKRAEGRGGGTHTHTKKQREGRWGIVWLDHRGRVGLRASFKGCPASLFISPASK